MRAIAAVAEYLQHAITCRELAERVTQRRDKKILEELGPGVGENSRLTRAGFN